MKRQKNRPQTKVLFFSIRYIFTGLGLSMWRAQKTLGSLIFLFTMIFLYQNCGGGFEAASSETSSSLGPGNVNGDSQINMSLLEPNLLQNCSSSPDYNSCIFWKNPVAQNRGPLPGPLTYDSDMSSFQVHAVNITGYDDSGTLGNSFIRVRAQSDSGSFVRVSTIGDQFKFNFRNDPDHQVGQIMAFYWLNLQKDLMKSTTGIFYADGRGIDVVSHVPNLVNAFWDPNANQVVMGATAEGNEFALSAEVYAHEMGHANMTYGTNRNIHNDLSTGKNRTCGGGQGVCCSTVNGCSWAINEGQADYHSSLLFPSSTAFLETLVNNANGIAECGVPRAIDLNANLSAQAAFDACTGDEGEVHVTGRIYASVWWEARKSAERVFPGTGQRDIDQLFTEHIPTLNGDDDFQTALDKIVATDSALFSGRYSQIFIDEFASRGISQ